MRIRSSLTPPVRTSRVESTANLKAQQGSQIKRTTGERGWSARQKGSSGGVEQLHGSATHGRHLNPYPLRFNFEEPPPIPLWLRFRVACNSMRN